MVATMKPSSWLRNARVTLLVSLAVVGCLSLTLLASYTLFHTLAEIFFVIVAAAVFLMSWMLREFLDDDLPVFIGVSLLAAAILHVVHTVDFPGVGIISNSLDPPTQLWVALVLLEGVSFVIAPFTIGHRIRLAPTLAIYLLLDGIILAAIYWWRVFPSAFNGHGLTPFKVDGEYAAMALFAVAALLFWWRRSALYRAAIGYLIPALGCLVVAEFTFTLYHSSHTAPNAVGHVFMVLAGLLIYRGVIEESLARPHALAVANLKSSEEEARAGQREEEAARKALDKLLAMTPLFYGEQDYADAAAAVCRAAREMFDCQAVTLHQVEGDMLVVQAIEPPVASIPPGSRFPVADDPDLAALLTRRIPSFRAEVSGGALGPGLARLSAAVGVQSVLRSPIGIHGVAERLLVLGWAGEPRPPDAFTLALVQRFADQADVALTQAGRREAQAEAERLHRRFERGLLPTVPVEHSQLSVRMHYRPREAHLELGGDFIDVLDRGDAGVAVIVGDVSGHGPDAAALGAMLRTGWHALMAGGADARTIVDSLRAVLLRERPKPETFATFCLAWIDPRVDEVALLNVAHPPPLLLDGDVQPLAVDPLPPLGTFDRPVSDPVRIPLPPDWRLFFYTDGLIEARAAPGSAERYGEARLIEALRRVGGGGLTDECLGELLEDIERAAGEPFADDVAVLVVSQSPVPSVSGVGQRRG
jgi:serine phosphatase RsbU (regulator of sigma subunit)